MAFILPCSGVPTLARSIVLAQSNIRLSTQQGSSNPLLARSVLRFDRGVSTFGFKAELLRRNARFTRDSLRICASLAGAAPDRADDKQLTEEVEATTELLGGQQDVVPEEIPLLPDDAVLFLASNVPQRHKYDDIAAKFVELANGPFVKFAACFAIMSTSFPLICFAEDEVTTPVFTAAFEGAGRFVHPMVMGTTYLALLYAGYLGWQVRRTREASGDEKKELIKGRFGDKHGKFGAVLNAVMIAGAVAGIAVTYNNDAKLYPGAHLYVGLALPTLMSAAASLAPWMRQGRDWARNLHIVLNTFVVLLYTWEVGTGIEIVQYFLSNP